LAEGFDPSSPQRSRRNWRPRTPAVLKKPHDDKEESSMRLRTCMLSAFTLSTAMSLGIAAMAADMPKEGTYSGTYSAFGTAKATPIGKERLLLVFDENGLSLSNGFQDHMTWHCWGMGDYTNGVGQDQGYCVATDPAGDQLVQTFVSAKHSLDQKSFGVSVTSSGGTGKYTGISGSEPNDVCHSGEFKPATEGTYLTYCTFQGSYKLP
jgi:hypothetical protein